MTTYWTNAPCELDSNTTVELISCFCLIDDKITQFRGVAIDDRVAKLQLSRYVNYKTYTTEQFDKI